VDHDIFRHPGRFTTKHRTSHHVAFLFKGRKLLAIGQNRVSEQGGAIRPTIHAEAAAIRAVGDISRLRGATLVVIRIGGGASNRQLMNSAPCPACQTLIQKCQREYGLRSCIHS
jgi:hypothetical protein